MYIYEIVKHIVISLIPFMNIWFLLYDSEVGEGYLFKVVEPGSQLIESI